MKSLTSFCLTAIAAATGWLGPISSSSSSLNAATVLAVDISGSSAATQQAGFTPWVWNGTENQTTPFSQSFAGLNSEYTQTGSVGSLTATVFGGSNANPASSSIGINFRDRPHAPANSGAFTQSALMRDRLVSIGSATANAGLFLELTGLTALATYEIQVWGFDTVNSPGTGAKPGTFTLYNWTNVTAENPTRASLGSFTSTTGQMPADNNTFSVTSQIQADANGRIVVQSSSNIDGSGIINGFRLTGVAVPEPTHAMLSLIGICFVSMRRRKVPPLQTDNIPR